ncbi:hypothetical protein [Glutamicibacter sp. FBE19]|uniref:hypothetical protein n=1 Tax=Glutamicibacter sp. FBE19 TaxID=2761534 RepID=UPI0018965586|nr:hypothetical protein [Glutamicibacter sp. FBE19]MBF6672444.1 hypothetical protein [Glutamicibacter sp. FBE19]
MYTRVKDTVTGNEIDVLSTDKRIGDVFKPVNKKEYPDSRLPRPSKYHVESKGVAKKPSTAAETKES